MRKRSNNLTLQFVMAMVVWWMVNVHGQNYVSMSEIGVAEVACVKVSFMSLKITDR